MRMRDFERDRQIFQFGAVFSSASSTTRQSPDPPRDTDTAAQEKPGGRHGVRAARAALVPRSCPLSSSAEADSRRAARFRRIVSLRDQS